MRRAIGIVAWLTAFHTLLAYGLPPVAFALIVVGLGVLYARSGVFAAVVVTAALLAVTLIYALVVSLTGLDQSLYYRPHEMLETYDYSADHRSYRRNAEVRMRMPHGDIQSMTSEPIAQPREVVFRTDSDGFRNDADYHGQPFVLVGDSFVAANGNSQPDRLDAQLARDFGIESYNLGHPGDPADYLAYVREFGRRHGENFRVLLFLFEGNDFPQSLRSPQKRRHAPWSLAIKRYYGMFSGTAVYRLTKSLMYVSFVRARGVEIYPVAGKPMAFYRPYIDETLVTDYRPGPSVEEALLAMKPRLAHIFFVPTKYRVYHQQVAPGESLPHAHWQWLAKVCERQRLACSDLTPVLIDASERLLAKGRYTWWLDDTHWNADGMRAAAATVAAAIGVDRREPGGRRH